MRRAVLPALASALTLAAPAAAVAACPADPDSCTHVALVLENDSLTFSGQDRNYSSGVLLAWSSRAYAPPAWAAGLGERAALLVPAGTLRWGLSFGQKIFTPEDTRARIPDPTDRPYAGWLFGAATLLSYTDTQLASAELQLGIVGPGAFGEAFQNTTHDILNIRRTRGWERQLKDEPGVNLVLTRQLRLNREAGIDGLSVGVVPSFAASIGNVNTYASAGAMLRIGSALDADFGPQRVRPASSGSVFFEPREGFGWYAFAGLEGRAVLRDISLDGNTWRDSPRVERETLVGDATAGLALMFAQIRVTATYTARSREFEGQRENAQFGSVSVAFRF